MNAFFQCNPFDLPTMNQTSLLARQARIAATLGCLLFAVAPAWAHHPLGGAVPATAWQGILSGLAHPVIEPDHLLFLLGAAVAAAVARMQGRRAALALVVYTAAGMAGALLRVSGAVVPWAESVVALSVLAAAGWLFVRSQPAWPVAVVLACVAGAGHGYAFGEAVVGAETTPVVAYLFGLALMQAGLMGAVCAAMVRAIEAGAVSHNLTRTAAILLGAAGAWFMFSTGAVA